MISPEQLIMFVDVMAIQLGQGKNADQLAVMGCVLNQLGDALSTMGAQKGVIEKQAKIRLEACAKANELKKKTTASEPKKAAVP